MVGKVVVAIFVVVEHIDGAPNSSVPSSSGVEESNQSNSDNDGNPSCDTTYEENRLTRRKFPRIHQVGIRTSNSTNVA